MRWGSGWTWRIGVLGLVGAGLMPASADAAGGGHLTSKDAYITLAPGQPSGSSVTPIISVGETVDGVLFEGLPDGIGMAEGDDDDHRPGKGRHGDRHQSDGDTVDAYIAHEQTTVPFFGTADFQDSSVTKLTLSTKEGHEGEVLAAEVVIGPELGYLRFCSAAMATTEEGFDNPVFFTGEETNDTVIPPVDAPYGPDPAIAPERQGGYVVAYDTATGKSTPIPGMGRLNHENTIALPGYKRIAMLTTDDTFSGPSAQLYLYLAANQRSVLKDRGRLMAFQVTHDENGRVDRNDPFNGANDYLDLQPGQEFKGRFIPVPKDIAMGTTDVAPQQALEDWSNENNVFQFIRLEDLAYDKDDPNVVYIADTGRSRVVPDPSTGRLVRGPSGTVGQADNGRVFKMVFDEHNPRKVTSLTVLAQGDQSDEGSYVAMVSPDNMDTSENSLMVQEDTDNARIWRHDLEDGTWEVVATVNDPDGESSGIVDASEWYGDGAWLLNVQAHGTRVASETIGDVTFKREDGQLILLDIPGS